MALTRVSRHIIDEPLELQNINATGIGTFASLRVTGDLQVDGTTTTLDTVVTEVDRLEVSANNSTVGAAITQTGSGDILNLFDGSTEVFSVTDGGKVKIGTETEGDNSADNLTIADSGNSGITIRSGTSNQGSIFFSDATSGSGEYDGFIQYSQNDQWLKFGTATSTRLTITSTGYVGFNETTPTNRLHVKETNSNTIVGRLESSVAYSYLSIEDNSTTTGNVRVGAHGNDLVMNAGAVQRLRITSDGKVRVPDNGKFVAGDGDDLQIYHDTNNSYIKDAGTGNLLIQGSLVAIQNTSGETIAKFEADGASTLNFDGSGKLVTTTNGISVTGQIDIGTTSIYGTGDISMGDSDQLRLGGGDDLRIYHDGSINRIRSDVLTVIEKNDSEDMASFMPDGAVVLFHNGSQKFSTTSDGATITGELGFASGGTYQLKLSDNQKIRFGGGNDLQIYHDGSHSYINQSTAGNLYITHGAETMIGAFTDGKVELRYDNSTKFETTTTGAKVTGALEVTQEYPSIRPTLDLNFAATKTLDRRITFTRDSLGTYTDENGSVKYASNNVPRFDHDPTTRESLGLLIEESRTNLFTYSNFTQSTPTTIPSGWNGWNPATHLTSQTLSPDGVDNGVFHGAINQNGGGLRKDITGLVAGGTYYITYYAKGLTSTELTYFTNNNARGTTTGTTDGAQNVSWFAATAVKFDCVNLNGTGASGSYQMSLTQDWQRFGATLVADNAGSARIIISNNVSDTGTGNEDGGGTFLIWGAQLELGAFPTSYIPTSGSTVTRADDFATIKGTNFTDFYNQTEGTLFGEFTIKDDTYSSAAIANINQEPGSSYAHSIMFVEVGTANGYFGRTYKNSSGVNISNSSSILNSLHPSTTPQKVTFGYTTVSGGELRAYWNGNNVNGSSDLSKVPTTLTNMRIGRGWTGSDVINAHIRKLSYYPKRLPNAQLQGLTQQ